MLGLGLGINRNIVMPAAWTPSQITTSLWLDAADSSTITESGGAVSQWDDKSGNDYHVTQGTGANQPSTGARTIGGLNAIDFVDDYMTNAALGPVFSGDDTPFAIYSVFQTDNAAGTYNIFMFGNSGNDAPLTSVFQYNDAYRQSRRGDSGDQYDSDNGTSSTNVRLASSEFDGTNHTWTFEGTPEASSSALASASSATFTHFAIGASVRTAVDSHLDGAIGEIILTPAVLSEADRQKLEGYLAWKWGLTDNLDVGHPYKTNPPTV